MGKGKKSGKTLPVLHSNICALNSNFLEQTHRMNSSHPMSHSCLRSPVNTPVLNAEIELWKLRLLTFYSHPFTIPSIWSFPQLGWIGDFGLKLSQLANNSLACGQNDFGSNPIYGAEPMSI
jgi:hypothetical protein